MGRSAATVVLGIVLGLAWLTLAGLGLSAASGAGAGVLPFVAASPSPDGSRFLQAAEAAQKQGDLVEADRLYRIAWADPLARRRAAQSLRWIHGGREFTLPIDEAQVREMMDQLGPGFVRYETARFVILSDADRGWTLSRSRLLERAHHQFFRVMDRLEYPAVPPAQKLMCIFFRDHRMYRAFAGRVDGVEAGWIAGYYTGRANRAVFYDDTTGPAFVEAFDQLEQHQRTLVETREQARRLRRERDRNAEVVAAHAEQVERRLDDERRRLTDEAQRSSEAKTIHEAVHLLAFNSGLQSRAREYPFWITEGLASSFETHSPGAAFGPDHPTVTREAEFEQIAAGGLLPLAQFVALTGVPDNDAALADVMYAQAYALFAYLYRFERRGLGLYLADFWAGEPGSMSDQQRLALFEARFGDVRSVERRWLRHIGGQVAAAGE